MKRLLLLSALALLAGCSTDQDPEDRAFFNRGWLNPHKDIDQDPSFDPDPGRMPKKVHPEKYRGDPLDY